MIETDALTPHTGWREFARLTESVSWARLRRHLEAWPEARLIDIACNRMTEATLDLTFRGHRFRIDEREGRYRLFVADDGAVAAGGLSEATGAVEAYLLQLLAPAG